MSDAHDLTAVIAVAKQELNDWVEAWSGAADEMIDAYTGPDWTAAPAKPAAAMIRATAAASGSMVGLFQRFAKAASELDE